MGSRPSKTTTARRREKREERREKSEERRERRQETREKIEDRPQEAATGPQMRPPEGGQHFYWPCRPLEMREERRDLGTKASQSVLPKNRFAFPGDRFA